MDIVCNRLVQTLPSFTGLFPEMKTKDAVVLFPGFGMGHLIPTVELAKRFAHHNFSVTVLLVETPFTPSSAIDPFASGVSSAHPLISFHRLPRPPELPSPPSNIISLASELFRLSQPLLLDYLQTLSQTANVRAVVLDILCTAALDVVSGLSLPTFFFFSSGASSLAGFLFVPTLQSQLNVNFKDLGDSPLHIPGLQPIPASHMPDQLQDRDDEENEALVFHLERLPKADGIIVNTFEPLEPRAVRALVDGQCVPGRSMPPVYCIGPMITDRSSQGEEKKQECLKWLDEQPKGSVVFLCFGSRGCFSAKQLKEIAAGLEKSGQKFLWAVRSPSIDELEPNLNVLMPEGFLERTEGRGMVIKSWAPQTAVLGHGSVGGFVSHCGWNSILEAVSAGVPMIAWPLYAEQKMNKVFLVEEAKLAVEMKGYDEEMVSAEEVEMKGYDEEMVSAEEVETKVRWLMESGGGRELRNRAAEVKESAVTAQKHGGSANKAWMELMSALKKKPDFIA